MDNIKTKGSNAILTSTANMEVLPVRPEEQTIDYKFYQFSLYNDQVCTVKVNDGDPIYLRAGQGFNYAANDYNNRDDRSITSFVIVESGITFNWVGIHG